MQNDATESFRHVYHLSRGRLWVIPIMWVMCTGLMLALLIDAPDQRSRDTAWFAAGVMTLVFMPLLFIIWQSRLVLTAQGIAHHQFGYTVRSTWANLEALTLEPSPGLYLTEPGTKSFLLRMSSKAVGGAMANGGASGVIGDASALARGRFIYLAPFMQHWKRGPLREDIRRRAPHLFDANGQPKP